MHLPTELWMLILEFLTDDEHLARPVYIDSFIKSTIQQSAPEEDLVRSLPAFERRAWLATKPYHAIDSTIRKAAQQVFLSGVVLQTCMPPLDNVPQRRAKGKKLPRNLKSKASESESSKPFYVPSALVRMKPLIDEDGELGPTYLALEVFNPFVVEEQEREQAREFKWMAWRRYKYLALELVFAQHYDRLLMSFGTPLRSLTTVELLRTVPHEDEYLVDEARKFVEEMKGDIEDFWKGLG